MRNSQIVQNSAQLSCDLVSVVNLCYVLIQPAFRSLGDQLWENLLRISAFINEKEENNINDFRSKFGFPRYFLLATFNIAI